MAPEQAPPPYRPRLWSWRRYAPLFALLLVAATLYGQPAASQSRQLRSGMDEVAGDMSSDPRLKGLTPAERVDLVEFVIGNMLFVAFHEMGHAVVYQMGLPVLGMDEDAADSFATLALLRVGTEFSYNVLVQSSRGWFLRDRRDRKLGSMLAFYDEHGLDKQRAFRIICVM